MVSAPIYIQKSFEDFKTVSQSYPETTKLVEEEEYGTDMPSMQEALSEATTMINSSKKPIIIAGVEIHRFGLQGVFD
jgi:indolepyruvate decarboxylase